MATTAGHRVLPGKNEEEEKFVQLDQKFDGAPSYENPLTIAICVILFIIVLIGVFVCYKLWSTPCGPSNNEATETTPPLRATLDNVESSAKLLEAASSSTVHKD
ncbi:hypothetical protein PRIPAC_87829 [Pristionchus pacificus]|uniref:Uncharacterized protein n=1 Tax=Pristionchus pacificus TaxID=54126 RepID=A0A2A6CW11_PRIPA|nr:hypothetical protein PRIPAC_87829 [Pristionchus pacificus]|eukprot:PDM82201.1 hypothetical protein PRIPAC_36594 [Pristionchus pacificus]